jgi:hypothetical protein
MFHDFHKDSIDLFSLNFGIINLIPKTENATKIQQYRPICVLNVSFKIFTKVGTNRLNKVARTMASPTQTGFMPGRNIMEGVVILHETIHELHTKKSNELFLRLTLKRPMIRLSGHSSSRLYALKVCHLNGVDGSKTWFQEEVWESKLMMTLDHTSKRNGGSDKGILYLLFY